MAVETVSALTELTSPAANDEIGIWDVSAGEYKKVQQSNLVGASITGGGTIALGGYTLTVPATGTAALRGTAQTFSALQTFSAGISLGNETLSTYDEGTWSPDLKFGGAKVGLSYASVAGRYVKIGKMVFVFCEFALANKGSSTGSAVIEDSSGVLAGLGTPITTSEAAVRFQNMTSSLVELVAETIGNAFYLLGLTAANTGQLQLADTDFANNSVIRFSTMYMV